MGTITLNAGSGSMTPFGFPRPRYGFDQVAVFTCFPGNGVQSILHGTGFGL